MSIAGRTYSVRKIPLPPFPRAEPLGHEDGEALGKALDGPQCEPVEPVHRPQGRHEKEPNTDIIVETRNADRRKTMSQKHSGLTVHTEGRKGKRWKWDFSLQNRSGPLCPWGRAGRQQKIFCKMRRLVHISILMAQRFGAGDFDRLRKAAASAILLSALCGILLTAGSEAIAEPVTALLRVPVLLLQTEGLHTAQTQDAASRRQALGDDGCRLSSNRCIPWWTPP